MPPSFHRSHYYLRDLAEACRCGYCKGLNYGYNRLDFARFNHLKDIHPQPPHPYAINYPPRRLAIRNYQDPNQHRRVFFGPGTSSSSSRSRTHRLPI